MQAASRAKIIFRFGPFEFDSDTRELRKHGLRVQLVGQPIEILTVLLEHAGELVRREELQSRLWAADTFVEFENGLNAAVKRLRERLGDSADLPRFIETVPRTGYRFIASVSRINASEGPTALIELPPAKPAGRSPTGALNLKIGSRRFAALALSVAVFLPLVFWATLRITRFGRTPKIGAIAVLPFANLSGDAEQDYFADGMTEELISNLSNVPALKVISRTSIMQFRHTPKSLPQIARELGVDAVVEGAVLRSGNRVRITAHLVDPATDTHIWSETYERDLQDVLGLQREVAQAVASHVSATVTPAQQNELASTPTVTPAAYEFYLKGRHFFWDGQFKVAEENFSEAIKLEPGYARAYAGLADSYNLRGNFTKGKAAAQKALELEPDLAEARTSLGWAKFSGDLDWHGAEEDFKLALKRNPNYENAHLWYGCELVWEGRFDQGLAEMRRAVEIAPTTSSINAFFGMALYQARHFDEAVKQLKQAIQLDPAQPVGYEWLGAAYAASGNYYEAATTLEKSVQLSQERPGFMIARQAKLGFVYGVAGRHKDAEAILGQLTGNLKTSSVNLARVYAGLGNKDQAFALLNQACERKGELLLMKVDPQFDSLRSDPRFAKIVSCVGFPE